MTSTEIYTRYDELVQPVEPPTAALDRGVENPNVTNILLQDVCPLNAADHLTIGTVDRLTQLLTLDALDNDGPTDLDRAGIDELACALDPLYVVPETFPNLVAQFQNSFETGRVPWTKNPRCATTPAPTPTVPRTTESRPLPPAPATAPVDPGDGGGAVSVSDSSTSTLPSTGRAIPFLAAGIAIGVGLLLRAGRSRIDRD